jgi:hypothetical protein
MSQQCKVIIKTRGNPKTGPSLLETEFLKLLNEELSIFLKGKNFTTIKAISVAVKGDDYVGLLKVG